MNTNNDEKDHFNLKTWVIPLPDFHFVHQFYDKSTDHRDFFGRAKDVRDFVEVLQNPSRISGSYLVTGYRGVGKTSFVKKVMNLLANGEPNPASSYGIFSKIKIISAIILALLCALFGGWDFIGTINVQINYFTNSIPSIMDAILHFLKILNLLIVIVFLPIFFYILFAKNINNWFKQKIQSFLHSTEIPNTAIILFALFYLICFPSGVWDYIVLLLLLLLYFFKKYQYAVFSPLQWKRWLFKPVVQVPVNLSHDIRDSKKVIFGMISLLREKYIESLRFTIIRFIVPIIVIIASATVAITAYRLFPSFHEYMEDKTQTLVFGTPPEKKDTLAVGASPPEKGKTETPFNPNEECPKKMSETPMLQHISEPDKWHVSMGEKNLDVKVHKETAKSGYVSFIREFILIPSYCATHHFSQDIYLFSYHSYWENDKHGPLLDRFASLFQLLDKLVLFFDPIIDRKRDFNQVVKTKKEMKKFAPRPYHILFFLLIFILLQLLTTWLSPRKKIIRRLNDIHRRIQASDIFDTSNILGAKFPFWRKRYQQFHRLDERQAENLLLQVLLDNANNILIQPHIIFLFDELDKINPPQEQLGDDAGKVVQVGLRLSESVRQRQHEIEQLLGNLKNLITTASCNFIFVAGREMMDANLADRGEIHFLHGSLFDRVYYIPSFLTDPSDGNCEDISSMIEQYVCRRLMSPICAKDAKDAEDAKKAKEQFAQATDAKAKEQFAQATKSDVVDKATDDYQCWSLKTYMRYLKELGINDPDRFRLISFLQDFVYFLSYRSGGNPKKLALQFEDFLQPLPKQYSSQSDKKSDKKYYRIFPELEKNKWVNKWVLHFDPKQQYRVQLIAHMFAIFHGSYSKLVSHYGDKLSVSVFSVLDYVFKFHSMSFARRDLERMPGALDIHRAPALPQIIEVLLDKILSPYHLIKIDNGFYHFQFARYIQREIVYISQFSEQDMAAFNFSLDESVQIKQHYRLLLNEQNQQYPKTIPEQSVETGIPGTYVLPYLHMVLGDLHAQDNEFDHAMAEYLNAVSHLNNKPLITELDAFLISYVRIMLQIGLLQERRMIYDSAVAFYFQAMEAVETRITDNKQVEFFANNMERFNSLIQPYYCLAFLHAKRDYNPNKANDFMEKSLKLLKATFREAESKIIFVPNRNEKNQTVNSVLIYKHHIRWAEMWMMRSQFDKAISQYLEAVKYLCYREAGCKNNAETTLTFSELGSTLAGLADACTALALNTLYNGKDNENSILQSLPDEGKSEKKSPCSKSDNENGICCSASNDQSEKASEPNLDCGYNNHMNDQELKEHLCDNVKRIIGWFLREDKPLDTKALKKLFNQALCLYILASHAYRLAGVAFEEARVLWKIAYAVAFGLSYIDRCVGKEFTKSDKDKIGWIFLSLYEKKNSTDKKDSTDEHKPQNPIRNTFSKASEGSYSIYRKHLQELGVKDSHFLRWTSPPLTQILIVLGNFWHAYWGGTDTGGKKAIMNEKAFEVIDMGAFPMNARILALYLKGRWYQKYASGEKVNKKKEFKIMAFRLLVQAVEDGLTYEGGFDYIALPLGIIHYHIWEIVKEAGKEAKDNNPKNILYSVKGEDDFKGNMQRYFP